jgi:ubiquinone/menaquinone biosynthesis C-methylase UbiE
LDTEKQKIALSETVTPFLETRLRLNKNSRLDFTSWLFERLKVQRGEKVLDVGCGTGAQTIPFLEKVGPDGHVCASDIAEESVALVRQRVGSSKNIDLQVGDMINLGKFIKEKFSVKKFTLAHSSYALYYCSNPHLVLDAMKQALEPDGRIAVFTPYRPHGMVEFVRRHCNIPKTVDASLNFGPEVLEDWFRASFWDVEIHIFQNVINLNSVSDFLDFYRATTYYDSSVEQQLSKDAEVIIGEKGKLEFPKSGYLIIGTNPKE